MTARDGLAVILAGAALAVVVVGELRDGQDDRTERLEGALCETWRHQAAAPAAPGAPQDPGSLATASGARVLYVEHRCEQAGHGTTPPVQTGRGQLQEGSP